MHTRSLNAYIDATLYSHPLFNNPMVEQQQFPAHHAQLIAPNAFTSSTCAPLTPSGGLYFADFAMANGMPSSSAVGHGAMTPTSSAQWSELYSLISQPISSGSSSLFVPPAAPSIVQEHQQCWPQASSPKIQHPQQQCLHQHHHVTQSQSQHSNHDIMIDEETILDMIIGGGSGDIGVSNGNSPQEIGRASCRERVL